MEQYRRRNFFINGDFQIRYCIYVCSWLFTLSIVYPWIIYEIFDFFIRYLALRAPHVVPADLSQVRTQLLWLLGTLQFVFLAVTCLISIFVSHRIAGPLHKLKVWMQESRKGPLRDDLLFRKSDYFKDIAGEYNQLVSSFSERLDRNVTRLESALKGANGDTKKQLEEAIADLKSVRAKPSSSGQSAEPTA